MKLLFVYQFCTRGGVEVVLQNRLEVLKKEFADVHADILFFADYGGKDIFRGLEQHIFIMNDPQSIRSFINKRKYDFIISIDSPQIYDIVANMNLRVILEVHTNYKENRAYLKSIHEKETETEAITVPSFYFKKVVSQEIGDNIPIYVFPNFIGYTFRNQCKNCSIKISQERKKCIGWVGRLDSLKNWREFLKIAKRLIKTRDDIEFLIVGGIEATDYEKNAFFSNLKSYRLLPHIKWLPFFSRMPMVYKYLSNSKGCFVSTSRGESLGMTVLESMICKCPVVCSNIMAYCELIDSDSRGKLYTLGDVSSAVDQINSILDDPLLRKKQISNAYKAVLEHYDASKIISDWLSFLYRYM